MRGAPVSRNLDDELNLDGRVEWKLRHPHRRTGMGARVAEHLAEQLRGPVDDARLTVESRRGCDEPDDLHHSGDGVDADKRMHRGQCVEGTRARQCLALLRAHLGSDLPDARQLARLHRYLSGRVDQVAGAHRRHIDARRRDDVGQLDFQLGEPGRPAHFGRLRYATCCSPVGPGSTETSSQPSSPHWSRICLVACVSSGTVAYSQRVGSLMWLSLSGTESDTASMQGWLPQGTAVD